MTRSDLATASLKIKHNSMAPCESKLFATSTLSSWEVISSIVFSSANQDTMFLAQQNVISCGTFHVWLVLLYLGSLSVVTGISK